MEKPIFRVVVAGGRYFNNYLTLSLYLNQMFSKVKHTHRIVIVCGEAKGADALGKRYAEENGYGVESYPADWDNLGRAAGHIRNAEMGEVADAVVAFWNGRSKGTEGMIKIAKRKKLPLRVFRYKGK